MKSTLKGSRRRGRVGCLAIPCAVAIPMLAMLTGCTTISYPLGPTTPPPSYQFLTGNWELVATSTGGTQEFGLLAGFIQEGSVDAGINDPVTASLQIEDPATCFVGTLVLPFDGALMGTGLTLTSFTDVSQFVTLTATKDATATHLNGTYSVGGGCASASQGAIVGTRYSPLAGTFSGPTAGGTALSTLSLSLTQSLQGNGDGTSNVVGSAIFTGSSCVASATSAPGKGFVLGSKVNLVFDTSAADAASTVTVTGTFDPAADRIAVTSIAASGGSCAGALGAATLTLQ